METNSKPKIETSYEAFSREPEYIEVNRAFIKTLPFKTARRILDLACGTGTISELILEVNSNVDIYGIDISRESLLLGQKDFLNQGFTLQDGFVLTRKRDDAVARLVLMEGSADCLPLRNEWADMAFMGNSIHLLPDLDLLLEEIRRCLVPQATFAFNSTFFAGTMVPGTDHFYQIWWKKALLYIMEKDAARKKQGLPGISRQRGMVARAKPWLSKEDWCARLQQHGFEVETVNERPIMMSESSIRTIGAYSGFARVALSGYPVESACEALVESVAPALKEAGVTQVPQLWLEISARKGGG